MCQDKYLTHVMLQKHHVPDIPFCYTTQKKEVSKFLYVYHVIIQKPVVGERAQDTTLVKSAVGIPEVSLDTWIFEQYIPGVEYRCLVLEKKVIAMQEKTLSPAPGYPWRKTYRVLDQPVWDPDMVHTATEIAGLFHMGFIAVDFILGRDNIARVLEANSAPGIYSFHHPDEGTSVPVAAKLLAVIMRTGGMSDF
jgi:glutathione synthase/RimK-type ligase-like ATP-grasp enzyme